ncbi:MAG: LysE/ArgO family amino acid transporter [Pseudorhodobacter sp.]|nr:LysE/ArgO family amino acid transporter [Pseudorhodobacter sp.]
METEFAAAIAGYLVAISLIAAIGAQNAFVLRQGIRREHVGWVVLTCAASDALLITAGVAGFGSVTKAVPWLAQAMLWGGVAFLLVYGALRFRAAWQGGASLQPADQNRAPLRQILLTCLVLTWANPHVYLDTLVLIGAVSTQYAPHHGFFALGAVLASASFFMALGYGARLLAPVFARPRAWVVLEVIVGATMWAIAATLAFGG